MPWAQPGGPDADLAWADANFHGLAPPLQQRTWNLSSIWTCFGAERSVWLKCVPSFFAHEGAVLERLQGRGVPELLAREGSRLLLGQMPGVDGFGCSEAEATRVAERLVALQVGTVPEVGDLARLGVPDARWDVLLPQLRALVERQAPEDANLARLLGTASQRVAAIDRCGLPDVLVHGDAHPGNARLGEELIWFDWGDSRLGNPLLDLAVTEALPADRRSALTRRWLSAWAGAVPGSDPFRAWPLARPLAVLRLALVYQTFLDNIEETEHVYHAGDMERALLDASAIMASEGAGGPG